MLCDEIRILLLNLIPLPDVADKCFYDIVPRDEDQVGVRARNTFVSNQMALALTGNEQLKFIFVRLPVSNSPIELQNDPFQLRSNSASTGGLLRSATRSG